MLSWFLWQCMSLVLHPDIWRNTTEMAEAYGYLHETHSVTTADGYILTLFRIPGKTGEHFGLPKVPLVMQPGIISGPDNLVAAGPPYAPAFYFVDHGLDVWIVASRGSRYSKQHVKYTTRDRAYWNFSIDEYALYDQPAYIDYIRKVTGFQKIHFFGHSQGGTQMVAGLTLMPEFYRQRLLSVVTLGMVANFYTTPSIVIRILQHLHILDILEFFGIYEFVPYSRPFGVADAFLTTLLPSVFHAVLLFASDSHPETLNETRAHVFLGNYPVGGSTKNMRHLLQLLDKPGFYRFREHPDDPFIPYNLANIPPIPLAVFGGEGDLMAMPDSILWLHNELTAHKIEHVTKIYPLIGHLSELVPNNDHTQHLADIYSFMKNAETL